MKIVLAIAVLVSSATAALPASVTCGPDRYSYGMT
jgi:hypothetical protein